MNTEQAPKDKQQKYLDLIYNNPAYQKSIKKFLHKFIQSDSPITTVKLLKTLYQFSYKIKLAQTNMQDYRPSFKQLYGLYQQGNKLTKLFAVLAEIVLFYQNHKDELKLVLLNYGSSRQVQFLKGQVLLLMSMMALGIAGMYTNRENFPDVTDFGWIFSQEKFKTITIIQYFLVQLGLDKNQSKTQFKIIKQKLQKSTQKLVIGRIHQQNPLSKLINKYGDNKMSNFVLADNKNSIQDYFGCLKIDFANQYIGGGSLMGGLVQQQIMVANHPQMYISVLFCERMNYNQAIYFLGFRKYWKNSGYSHSTKFEGRQTHTYHNDQKNIVKQYITAIDAFHYQRNDIQNQFSFDFINRELIKAFIGFNVKIQGCSRVATGNWGCGVFNGNIGLKFMIQWIACSMAGRQMIYCPFERKQLYQFTDTFQKIKSMKIRYVYQLILRQSKNCIKTSQNILNLIKFSIFHEQKQQLKYNN